MNGIIKRKLIGLIVTLSFWVMIGIMLVFPFIKGEVVSNILAILALGSGPVGLLIMGSGVDGKPNIVVRLAKTSMSIAKWGWLLIPIIPIDLIFGLIFLMIGIEVFFVGVTIFAFVPALIDFIKTLIIVKREDI